MKLPIVCATVLLTSVATTRAQEVTGALREGIYSDTDHTQVIRSLAAGDAAWSGFHLSAKESVDIVSSASLDVRSSPALDAVTSASAAAPGMSDNRFETIVGLTYDDGRGHTGGVSAVYAVERDYTSTDELHRLHLEQGARPRAGPHRQRRRLVRAEGLADRRAQQRHRPAGRRPPLRLSRVRAPAVAHACSSSSA